MTRGRKANIAHLIAENVEQARELWVEAFSRDRADLGPAVAAQRAAIEADRYAPQRPLDVALADLRAAWTIEADTRRHHARATAERDLLREYLTVRAEHDATIGPLDAVRRHARDVAAQARQHAEHTAQLVDTTATEYAGVLTQRWAQQRPAARDAARTVLAGPGRLGLHRRAVTQADTELQQWADTWRPVVTDLPTDPAQLALLGVGHDTSHVDTAIDIYARTVAEAAHPEHQAALATAQAATDRAEQTERAYQRTVGNHGQRLIRYGNLAAMRDPEALMPRAEWRVTELTTRHESAYEGVRTLLNEPALRSQPVERLHAERATWQQDRTDQHRAERAAAAVQPSPLHRNQPGVDHSQIQPPDRGHGISF
jgi:hypothetical protein